MFGGMLGGVVGSLAGKVKGAMGKPGLKRRTDDETGLAKAMPGSKAGAMATKKMTGKRSLSGRY